MSFDVGGVDHYRFRRPSRSSEMMKELVPDTFLGPADKAIVECLVGAIGFRGIFPTAA